MKNIFTKEMMYSELALSFAGHLVERLEAIHAWR